MGFVIRGIRFLSEMTYEINHSFRETLTDFSVCRIIGAEKIVATPTKHSNYYKNKQNPLLSLSMHISQTFTLFHPCPPTNLQPLPYATLSAPTPPFQLLTLLLPLAATSCTSPPFPPPPPIYCLRHGTSCPPLSSGPATYMGGRPSSMSFCCSWGRVEYSASTTPRSEKGPL